jgi:hypothetical protein
MAKEPVLAPKVTTSWGIDHYASLEAGYVAPVVEETPVEQTPLIIETPVEEVVEDVE